MAAQKVARRDAGRHSPFRRRMCPLLGAPRLSTTLDKRVALYRSENLGADKEASLGLYLKRGDATKAVAQVAYQVGSRR